MRIMVANRGEIALRIMRTIKELGHESVAIYSRADENSLHVKYADIAVCVGENQSSGSYLNIPNILSAATQLGVDAIHPGYGFLSENANFIKLLEELEIGFIGPKASAIELMGDKINAVEAMEKANVPIVRGTKDIKDAQHAIKSVKELGLPVIIKAAGGGGGKGLRIVRDIDEVESSFNAVISEAKVTDPDPRVFIEQFIENAKHIEVQVIADKFGNAVHLGTRDCSMQRNNQKIIEEAPALILKDLEEEMCAASLRAVKEIGYINAGTFEYLVCENKFYFLEMNTRLQVEHTVTEQVFGIDIVKEQINIELDRELSFTQADVEVRGHAIECRINAEDPFHNFTPCPGKITHMHLPGGYNVRNDFGVYANGVVPIFYDSLVGKIIVTGHTRIDAINNMKRALDEFQIEGIKTTVSFQEILLDEKEYVENTYATTFIEQNYDRILSEVNDVQFN